MSMPLQAKQLMRSINSMVFISWEMQYNENGHNYGQLVIGSFITIACLLMHHIWCRVFGESSNHPGDSAPLQPRYCFLWLLAFPKTKITFEREDISDHQWDSGKYNRAADDNSNKGFCKEFGTVGKMPGELCEIPSCLLWRGLKHPFPMYKVSFILHILQ